MLDVRSRGPIIDSFPVLGAPVILNHISFIVSGTEKP
jgi:hypothetical protein